MIDLLRDYDITRLFYVNVYYNSQISLLPDLVVQVDLVLECHFNFFNVYKVCISYSSLCIQ